MLSDHPTNHHHSSLLCRGKSFGQPTFDLRGVLWEVSQNKTNCPEKRFVVWINYIPRAEFVSFIISPFRAFLFLLQGLLVCELLLSVACSTGWIMITRNSSIFTEFSNSIRYNSLFKYDLKVWVTVFTHWVILFHLLFNLRLRYVAMSILVDSAF